jgi:hypothetical protein
MPLISPCIEPGCSKLCMGLFCIDHDSGPRTDLPRGRPWPPARRGVALTVAATAPRLGVAPPEIVRTPVSPAA